GAASQHATPKTPNLSFVSFRSAAFAGGQKNALNLCRHALRTFDNSMSYCVYKLNDGGACYVFFHGEPTFAFADYLFIVKKPLKKSDFLDLKVGDTISKVETIDEGMQAINSIQTDYLFPTKTSLHMVKDGFVKITYTSKTDNIDDFKVKSIEFIENGSEINMNGFPEEVYYWAKPIFYLLPQDYPQ
ncbi:MAG: hypothetical protein LBS74_06395, partial [Oscillospiraceae bacterium]|nr:hypothetical protein [Oscillospiraceae bacterium]